MVTHPVLQALTQFLLNDLITIEWPRPHLWTPPPQQISPRASQGPNRIETTAVGTPKETGCSSLENDFFISGKVNLKLRAKSE